MADFVTVLRRAVENQEDQSEGARKALYEKAKTALLGQLRALDPPLSEEELERQSESLDRAVEQVEAEYAASESHQEFRSAVADAARLGGATSTAARSARDTLGHLDGDHDGDYHSQPSRIEPTPPPAYTAGRTPYDAPPAPPPPPQQPIRPDPGYGEPDDAPHAPEGARRDVDEPSNDASDERPDDTAPAARPPVLDYADDDASADRRGGGRLALWAGLFLLVGVIAAVALWQRDSLTEIAGNFTGSTSQDAADGGTDDPAPPEMQTAQGDEPRVPQADTGDDEQAMSGAEEEGQRTAQALLVEESSGENGSTSSLGGSVDWALLDDTESAGGPEKVIRGTVRIPDKGLALALAIRRNTDADLPASHTIEILFDVPAEFENGGIEGVPGLIMKATPQSQGQPLVGAVVPVTDNFFLVGLSQSRLDRQRNVDEMKRRAFIDLPLAYEDGSRAVLSIAKGESGEEVFAQAFEAWGE